MLWSSRKKDSLRNSREGVRGWKRALVVFLCITTLGSGLMLRPQEANAQFSEALSGAIGGVGGCLIGDIVGGAVSSAIDKGLGKLATTIGGSVGEFIGGLGGGNKVPILDETNDSKECILDGVAKALASAMLQSLTHSIVDWVLTGFDGSPAFVTDLKGYLLNIADEVAGEYIYGSDLDFICSPFEFQVRLNLAFQFLGDPNPVQCTLSDALGNVEEFFAGNFAEGGFPRWLEVFAHQQNTPWGAAQVAEAELQIRLADAQRNAGDELNFGDGFLPFKKCDKVEAGDHPGRANEGEEYCYTTTPGQVISDQLTFHLKTGSMQLLEADEINESISAIIAALAYKALETGLSALNDDGYLDKYGTEAGVIDSPDFEVVHGGSSETLLWKPTSEVDGKLVVLTPTGFGTPSVRLLNANGGVIETGDYVGHHNGNRAHYRFNQTGAAYPPGTVLAVDGNRYQISAGTGARNEGGQLRDVTSQNGGGGGSSSGGNSGSSSSGNNEPDPNASPGGAN